jgi:hypothetical protein
MATKQLNEEIPLSNNYQSCEFQTEDKSLNCVKMEERLASALIDLKTVETTISTLSADLNLNSELCASDKTNLNLVEWSVVKSNHSVNNQGETQNATSPTYNSVTTNTFAPLEYLGEPQTVILTTENKDQEIKSTRQQYGGFKIPTIVNGTTNSSRSSKLSTKKKAVLFLTKYPFAKYLKAKKHDK